MFFTVLITILAIFVGIYYYYRRCYSYWSSQGVAFIKPKAPWGNIKELFTTQHDSTLFQKFYNQLKGKGPFGGIFFFWQPAIVVTDLDCIKTILVKDFQYFVDRGFFYNDKDDPVSAHMFAVDSDKWRRLRTKLTPTFSSGKMKFMFPTIVKVAKEFQTCIHREMASTREIEMKDIVARFTTDVIGSCAFGLECNSLYEGDTQFRNMGRKAFSEPFHVGFKRLFVLTFPNAARRIGMKAQHSDVTSFFFNIVKDTIEYRDTNKIQRNDFVNLLMELRADDGETPGLSVIEITAQSFIFFLAGFETSSTTMSYALYELALREDLQSKARDEVKEILQNYDGEWSYEAMMDMKYVEQIIKESLRKYPPVTNITRRAIADYTFKENGVTLTKGTRVFIPAYAIQHDPDHYADPETFDPDRFSAEEVKNRNPYSFLPFGEGPRNCVGLRFGMMQARLGLAMLLQQFKFMLSPKTINPIRFLPQTFILHTEGGLWLQIESI